MDIYSLIKSAPVILYGAGEIGVTAGHFFKEFHTHIYYCDKNKVGIEPQTGLPIISPGELKEEQYKSAHIIISSDKYHNEISQDLIDLGIDSGRIIPLSEVFDTLPDETYVKHMFKRFLGYDLYLDHPKTFNEKIQWLKLYDRKPEYAQMADKYEARRYIADKIGEEYFVPLLGVWDKFDDIDFDLLPNQFVLKCTHDSGSVVICKDKSEFDINAANNAFSRALKKNYYYHGREYCYKNIKPRIIAEEYLEDYRNKEVIDYKLMCFNGKVKCSFTCTQRRSKGGLRVTFFDNEWNKMPFYRKYPSDENNIEKPVNLNKMHELSEKLSQGIAFLRVDFFEIENKLYIGELTFYPGSGFEYFEPFEYDQLLGSWITLPERI